VFFSGVAGTGKSFTLGHIVKSLRKRYPHEGEVIVTAPTGVASLLIGGQVRLEKTCFRGEDFLRRRRTFFIRFQRVCLLERVLYSNLKCVCVYIVHVSPHRWPDAPQFRRRRCASLCGRFQKDHVQARPVAKASGTILIDAIILLLMCKVCEVQRTLYFSVPISPEIHVCPPLVRQLPMPRLIMLEYINPPPPLPPHFPLPR
jgi:hypothetical protein